MPAAADQHPVERCPSCNGAVPVKAAWCGLCWADLRPATEHGDGDSAASDPATSDRAPRGDTGPSWPCLGCGRPVALQQTACPDCGTGFLRADAAGLGGGDSAAPRSGWQSRLTGMSRGGRTMLAFGTGVLLAGVPTVTLLLVDRWVG